MQEFFRIFTLILPILIPGLTLIVVLKLNILNILDIPIDLRITFNKKRLFGDNKTLKGLFVMSLVGIATAYILKLGLNNNLNVFIHPIFNNQPVIIGLIYSISYTMGELINSFIKRRLNISAGQSNKNFNKLQQFFDLSDGIIITVTTIAILTSATLLETLIAGILGIFIHCLTDILMKKMRLKK